MRMHDLEQRVINALHQEHAAETLRAWIGGEGMPNRLLADLVSRLHPDDDAILRLVLERERRLASTPAPAQFWPALEEFAAAALVQPRHALAYGLTYPARSLLIARCAPGQAWYEANSLFMADQDVEIAAVERAVGVPRQSENA